MDIEAVVTRTEEGHAFVKVSENPGGCGRCHEEGGCSTGVLTQIFKRQSCREFRLPNDIGARQGDRVLVSLEDGATLKAALAVYMLPVVCVLAGAWIGTWLDGGRGSDLMATVGACAGFVVSLFLVGVYRRRHAAGTLGRPVLSQLIR